MAEKYVVNGEQVIAGVAMAPGSEVSVTNPGMPGKVNLKLGTTIVRKVSPSEWDKLLKQNAVYRQQ